MRETPDLPPLQVPQRGDRLFRDDLPDWQNNACLNYGSWEYLYSEDFLCAARALVEKVVDSGHDQDIGLTECIHVSPLHRVDAEDDDCRCALFARSCGNGDRAARVLGSSRTGPTVVEPQRNVEIDTRTSDAYADLNEAVDDVVNQLAEFDPDSQRFRYSRTLKGEASLPRNLLRLNIRNFAETMERLVNYFSFNAVGLNGMADGKADMERETWD